MAINSVKNQGRGKKPVLGKNQEAELMDERAAASAFKRAMETHKPVFEAFFFSRFLGLKFDYADGQCIATF